MKIKKVLKICITFLVVMVCMQFLNVYTYAATNYSPTSKFYINDFANILSDSTEEQVFNIARQVDEKTTAQIVVVTVPNMEGQDIDSYTVDFFNKWKIGAKDKDNGILLLISKDERKIRIEVGYGANGFLNAGKAGRILDDKAIPHLKNNDYDNAIISVINELQGIVYAEYGVEGGFDNYTEEENGMVIVGALLPFVFFILIIVFSSKKGSILPFIFFGGGPRGPFGGNGGGRRLRRWRIWTVLAVAEALLAAAVLQEVSKLYKKHYNYLTINLINTNSLDLF